MEAKLLSCVVYVVCVCVACKCAHEHQELNLGPHTQQVYYH